ncbi:MAG TPA: DUF1152 domain-containing protein [Jatrophihabitantaceae bacterium]|jgi:hypothetical protein|nr:DUF1152 domain-containing protein [Jatrophihabitantaceae bacterium]
MQRWLYIAAGGGGDLIAAAMIHRSLGRPGAPVIATYAWERLIYDPLPGPRSWTDFDRLSVPHPGVREITTDTAAIPPARSPLPRQSVLLEARIILLDPTEGQVGLRQQLGDAIHGLECDQVEVIDVGGDVLAVGTEPGLRSPLADSLIVAACIDLPVSVRVIVAGPALDGELSGAEFAERTAALAGEQVGRITPDAAEWARAALDEHPSESSRLLAAAAAGMRGIVAVRESGTGVPLTDASTAIFSFSLDGILRGCPLPSALVGTRSLEDASASTRELIGRSELDYERVKAERRGSSQPLPNDAEQALADGLRDARGRGADFVTPRRLAELAGQQGAGAERLLSDLAGGQRPPLLWATRT